MYQLSRTVPVNEAKKSFLSRHDVWTGLLMKANNALPRRILSALPASA